MYWRTEKIVWANHVKNEEVLHRDKGNENILHTIKPMKVK